MSSKRNRSAFEADLQAKESPYVTYGTPLPPLDSHTRDDGSYVPVWKQEVTDEHGRKRLHGAFTGGFSAGYFNSVGSKEGWTPSTFVSSRTNRRKDDTKQTRQRPEDFMDEEDLAEAAEAQALQTKDSFAGFGSTAEDAKRKGMLIDLFRPRGETMGVKLLRKMGWRDGQGIGPRVRRKAKLDDGEKATDDPTSEDHFFAPEDSSMIEFQRKNDQKGLGFEGEERLEEHTRAPNESFKARPDEDEDGDQIPASSIKSKPKIGVTKGGIGAGVLNDTGSDDEDPYEVGPRISYNRVIGGDKKKKKKRQDVKASKPKPIISNANPLVGSRPVFVSKKSSAPTFRRCHDGRLPLEGFLLGDTLDASTSVDYEERYPRPRVPDGWQSSKSASSRHGESSTYQSTADAARLSKLDAGSRAAILGETQLPGKSVFDYLSTSARDRIASATGRTNLPQALNESIPQANKAAPAPSASTEDSSSLQTLIPDIPKDTALAALGRGTTGWMPYASEPAKGVRYRALLEYRGGLARAPPTRPPELTRDAWAQELREFAHAAEVFKPMKGLMASRFTSSSAAPAATPGAEGEGEALRPAASGKREDPAEEAARLGMFGPMTRSVRTFFPTRLVCKRFGVKPPEHVVDEAKADEAGAGDGWKEGVGRSGRAPELVGRAEMDRMRQEGGIAFQAAARGGADDDKQPPVGAGAGAGSGAGEGLSSQNQGAVTINAETNEALESKRAGDELFKAIFGDDDSD